MKTLSERDKKILENIKEWTCEGEVLIAGGYVRDVANDKEWKDIDVFIPNHREGRVKEWLGYLDYKVGLSGEGYEGGDITSYFIMGSDVNLVFVNTPNLLKHMNTFDINICKIGMWLHTNQLLVTDDYLEGITEQVVRC